MTVLPEISREAKIVSGKDQKAPASTHVNFDDDLNRSTNALNKDDSSKYVVKKPRQPVHSSEPFPNLIYNDGQRSTSYRRLCRSSDFASVKNSPLATNLYYNWQPHERLASKVVQAKVMLYKPTKRIEMTGRPSSPYKLKVDYETSEPHFHNEKRSLEMKRLQYLREHTGWSIYPYAGIEEREEYK